MKLNVKLYFAFLLASLTNKMLDWYWILLIMQRVAEDVGGCVRVAEVSGWYFISLSAKVSG